MATTPQCITTGTQVRVTSPTAPDFGQVGTVADIHHGDTIIVRFDGYCRSYGAGELAMVPPAPTVYDLGFALRGQLLAAGHEAAGALTFLVTAAGALKLGAARRKAAARRDARSPRLRARDKARAMLASGATVTRDGAAVLVSSATRAGRVHRVEGGRCSCEAAGPCWHLEAARLAPPPVAARAFRVLRLLAARRSPSAA